MWAGNQTINPVTDYNLLVCWATDETLNTKTSRLILNPSVVSTLANQSVTQVVTLLIVFPVSTPPHLSDNFSYLSLYRYIFYEELVFSSDKISDGWSADTVFTCM